MYWLIQMLQAFTSGHGQSRCFNRTGNKQQRYCSNGTLQRMRNKGSEMDLVVITFQSGGIDVMLSAAKLFDAYIPDWIAEAKAPWAPVEDSICQSVSFDSLNQTTARMRGK